MLDRSFGHYARVLIDLNLNDTLCHRILVERTGYAFFVDVEYENLPDFCSYCKCTGHYLKFVRESQLNLKRTHRTTRPKSKCRPMWKKKNKEPEVVNVEDSTSKSINHEDVDLGPRLMQI